MPQDVELTTNVLAHTYTHTYRPHYKTSGDYSICPTNSSVATEFNICCLPSWEGYNRGKLHWRQLKLGLIQLHPIHIEKSAILFWMQRVQSVPGAKMQIPWFSGRVHLLCQLKVAFKKASYSLEFTLSYLSSYWYSTVITWHSTCLSHICASPRSYNPECRGNEKHVVAIVLLHCLWFRFKTLERSKQKDPCVLLGAASNSSIILPWVMNYH